MYPLLRLPLPGSRAGLLAAALTLAACGPPAATTNPDLGQAPQGPATVNPFVGSGGQGFGVGSAFLGAAAPHGLVKAGADTWSTAWKDLGPVHCAGYWYPDDYIEGFSMIHAHGIGVPDYGVLGVMPMTTFDATRTSKLGYKQKFTKASESAAPGYYGVTTADGVQTEITATAHAAHWRFTFPAGATVAHIIVDLAHAIGNGHTEKTLATLDPSTKRIHGSFISHGDLSGYAVPFFFEILASAPWTASQVWTAAAPTPTAGTAITSDGGGLDLQFPPGQPVELQIGLSMISADGARANLAAEMTAFDFAGTRAATAAAWQKVIDRVTFTGGTDRQRTILASALYHLYLMPSQNSDVDGSYRSHDGTIKKATGFTYVSDLSLWDTYRTLHPLYDLIAVDDARDAVRSLVDMAQGEGHFPKWPLANGDTGSMIGASAEVVLADAYVKGVTDFDAEAGYAILRAAAMSPTDPPGGRGGRNDVVEYMHLGYVAADVDSSVSETTEYAWDDFALGNLAAALGHSDDAAALATRRTGYRKLFDPTTGFFLPRNASGAIAYPNIDPVSMGGAYREANAWQSVWYANHDIDGMIAMFGSRKALIDELTTFFQSAKDEYDSFTANDPRRLLPRPYYWHGNEPDIQAAWIFAQAGRPDLTQKWVRWAAETWYTDGPDGLAGNDDGGTLSAWYVWAAMGLYPLAGSDRYVVGAPLFPHLELAVKGGTFTIDAAGASGDDMYVQSVTLDGSPIAAPALRHADLHPGGKLVFTMGPAPGTWGVTE